MIVFLSLFSQKAQINNKTVKFRQALKIQNWIFFRKTLILTPHSTI
ncbi:hypothetical protein ABIB40_001327 [Pedobacter sp. UYP30]